MKEKYRQTEKELNAYASSKSKKTSKHVICMNVKDDSNFLSFFSENETPVISQEVADFIETSTNTLNPRDQLTLKIKSSCIDENEKVLYRKAIKEYYAEKYAATRQELKKNYFIAYSLALIGIFVLALAVFLEYRRESLIWSEVIDIVAWVFLWEAVDISFLQTRKLKMDRRRYISFAAMDIEFEDLRNDVNKGGIN